MGERGPLLGFENSSHLGLQMRTSDSFQLIVDAECPVLTSRANQTGFDLVGLLEREEIYVPVPRKTTSAVRMRIFRSSQKVQFSI